MRQFRLFGGIEGYYRFMKTIVSINKNQGDKTAKYRLKVLQHYWRYGLASTLDAFPVSRASLFRWQKQLKESGGRLNSLVPRSTKPKRVRQMQVPLALIDKIKQLRKTWPNLSKHKIKPLLDSYCQERGLKTISATTIGKVIKKYDFFYKQPQSIYHDPNRKRLKTRQKVRVYKAPKHQIGYIEADLIETRVDGKKRYTVCWIDIGSKIAFSKSISRKSSKQVLDSFLEFEQLHPCKIKVFQTDNGSEFEGALNIFLQKNRPNIKRRYTPNKAPKINSVVERYNRSLQEDWLNHNLHLFHDEQSWNKSLADYVHFYNYYRVHDTLQYQTPMQYAGVQKSLKCP
jgi:transposase InsO family protein